MIALTLAPFADARTVVGIWYSLLGRFELTWSPPGILKYTVAFADEPRVTEPPAIDPVTVWPLAPAKHPAIAKIAAKKVIR